MVSEVRPKVVRIIARMNVGGPARHAVLLDGGLAGRGFDTLLVHGSLDEDEASLEHLPGEHQLAAIFIPELGRRIRPFDDACALWKLMRVMFRERPDIVHTHTAKAGALGRIAAIAFNLTRRRKRRCLVVHTFHGHVLTGYFPAATSRLIGWVERGLALGTDRVITLSPGQRHELVHTLCVAPAARTVIVPLGLNLEPLLNLKSSGLRSELGIGVDDFVVGYVGRFVPIKDLPTLVRGFSRVVHTVPRAWLLLAGDGPARASLESLAVELGVSDRVRCLGWTQDLPACTQRWIFARCRRSTRARPWRLSRPWQLGRPSSRQPSVVCRTSLNRIRLGCWSRQVTQRLSVMRSSGWRPILGSAAAWAKRVVGVSKPTIDTRGLCQMWRRFIAKGSPKNEADRLISTRSIICEATGSTNPTMPIRMS